MIKKVFISGCFDLLHTGHMAFFEEASKYGQLYVAIGSDETMIDLKGKPPINNQHERLYAVQSSKYVHNASISSGCGILDFKKELEKIKPDILIVNEDGNYSEKENLCKELGIEYIVLERKPHKNLPARSTTQLRNQSNIPYRIDLAGGWMDQKICSSLHPGSVITISIEPTIEFNNRSGMASSTRDAAIELWQDEIPSGSHEIDNKSAFLLFCFENPPGSEYISGSQDAIGIVSPGLNLLTYEGNYWPHTTTDIHDDFLLDFIETSLYLIPLTPRESKYNVMDNTNITEANVKDLAEASENCWKAILNKDIEKFGKYVTDSFHAQIKMFPNMINDEIWECIRPYTSSLGWKLSGAGGGGYLILVSDVDIPHSIRIDIRRKKHYEIL